MSTTWLIDPAIIEKLTWQTARAGGAFLGVVGGVLGSVRDYSSPYFGMDIVIDTMSIITPTDQTPTANNSYPVEVKLKWRDPVGQDPSWKHHSTINTSIFVQQTWSRNGDVIQPTGNWENKWQVQVTANGARLKYKTNFSDTTDGRTDTAWLFFG